MTKQNLDENKDILAQGLFDTLVGLYAFKGITLKEPPPDIAVLSVVRGYISAYDSILDKEINEEAAPAKPKQRRARRKKADMVALAAEVAND